MTPTEKARRKEALLRSQMVTLERSLVHYYERHPDADQDGSWAMSIYRQGFTAALRRIKAGLRKKGKVLNS